MKKVLLIIFLFNLALSLFAATLKGRVVSNNTGRPIADANVVLQRLNKHQVTDSNGFFEFTNIPEGKYTIDIVSIEIQKKSFHIHLNSPIKEETFKVELSEFALSEVHISAKSNKKKLETEGFAVSVIDVQKIAVQSIDLNELLDNSVGVKVRQDGGLGSRVNYNINGMSGNAIKVFIDGIPASNFGSSFSLTSIPPALIDRIEVYKGVVPASLSDDALGGAINVIMKEKHKNALATSMSAGSFGTYQWNMTGSARLKNGLTFDGSGFYNYSKNDYKVWGKDIEFVDWTGAITPSNGKKVKRFHDAYKSGGGRLRAGFTDVSWADQFFIGGVFSKDYKEMQHGITMRNVYGDRHSRRKSAVATLSYIKRDLFTKGLDVKLDASHSYLRRQVIDTVGIMYSWGGPILDKDGNYVKYSSGAEVGSEKTTAINRDYSNMVKTNISYTILDDHRLSVNYLFNDFKRRTSDAMQPAALRALANTRDLQKNILSASYEAQFFNKKLLTNIFYKHYFQTVTLKEPVKSGTQYIVNETKKNMNKGGYGITASYAILPELYITGSAEKALRLPNENEMFGNIADNLLPPSPELKPEESDNYNIGLNYTFTFAKDHTINAISTFFIRDTKGMIREAIQTGSFTYSKYENLDNVLSRGVDVELNYLYSDKLNFRFNLSKFDVLFNTKYDSNGHPYNYYKEQIRNEPSFKFNSSITYFHKNLLLKGSKASITYGINYVKEFYRNWKNVGDRNLAIIPTQYPMYLSLNYTFPQDKLVFGFDIKNIFDKQIYDNYGLQKPGRGFYAKLTYFIL